jgi:hypothetical protein
MKKITALVAVSAVAVSAVAVSAVAVCPVADIERQILASMDVYDAAQRELWLDPAPARKAFLEVVTKDAEDLREALEEAVPYAIATSPEGQLFQMTEALLEAGQIRDNVEGIEEEGFAPNMKRLVRLIAAVGQSIKNTLPAA